MTLQRQLILIILLAIVLGALNNLRPKTHIPWIQKWVSQEKMQAVESNVEEGFLDQAAVEMLLVENQGQGPTDIFFQKAKSIYDHGKDLTVWIDARTPDLYEEGHIPGAHLLDFYNQMEYLAEVEAIIAEKQPIALVVYCKGADCPDSHFLAESLFTMGYDNLFVYKGGWAEWYDEKGLPIEGTLASLEQTGEESHPEAIATTPESQTKAKPKGMYAEHVIRDLFPFLAGLVFLGLWGKLKRSELTHMLAALLIGVFFIAAAVPKIATPFIFAKDIWNYNLVPDFTINIAGLTLPWIEFIAGTLLIAGMVRPRLRPLFLNGSSLIISGLLVIFILAVGFNVLRGHEFNCGCMGDSVFFEQAFWPGWDDKITLLLRDAGLLILSGGIFLYNNKRKALSE